MYVEDDFQLQEYTLKLSDPKYKHLIEPIRDMYMVKITKEDLISENLNMNHRLCDGDDLINEISMFYSLRDNNNKPHVTIEIECGRLIHIKAKTNKNVKLNYSSYVVDWLLKHREINIEELSNMQISNEDFERLKLSNRISDDFLLDLAFSNGNIEKVKDLINKNPNLLENKNYLMSLVASYGHLNIINLMIEHGAVGFNSAMFYAAENGHINIVKLMIEYGANDFNKAMYFAALGSHIDIVKLMIEHGANNFNETMSCAAHCCCLDIIKLMIQCGANNFINIIESVKIGWQVSNNFYGINDAKIKQQTDIINYLEKQRWYKACL